MHLTTNRYLVGGSTAACNVGKRRILVFLYEICSYELAKYDEVRRVLIVIGSKFYHGKILPKCRKICEWSGGHCQKYIEGKGRGCNATPDFSPTELDRLMGRCLHNA